MRKRKRNCRDSREGLKLIDFRMRMKDWGVLKDAVRVEDGSLMFQDRCRSDSQKRYRSWSMGRGDPKKRSV